MPPRINKSSLLLVPWLSALVLFSIAQLGRGYALTSAFVKRRTVPAYPYGSDAPTSILVGVSRSATVPIGDVPTIGSVPIGAVPPLAIFQL